MANKPLKPKNRKPKKTELDRLTEWKDKLKDPTRPTREEMVKGFVFIERAFADTEDLVKLLSDPNPTAAKRLATWKRLTFWPRTVLAIYEAELKKAQTNPEKGAVIEGQRHGGEKPSDTALRVVAEVIGVKSDRVHQLLGEARRELSQGAKRKAEMSAEEFRQILEHPKLTEFATSTMKGLKEKRRETVVEFFEKYYKG